MNTNFLSRLTSRTLGAGAIIRPQPVAPDLGRAAEPTGLDHGPLAGDTALVSPPTNAPGATPAAPTAVAFADDAPALLLPPVTAKAIFPSQSLVRTRPEAQAVAPAAPIAHTEAVPATQTEAALAPFSPLVAPARNAARNNRLHQAPDQTPSVTPAPLMAHPAVGSSAPQARPVESEVPPAARPFLSAQHSPHVADNLPAAVRTQPLVSATTALSAPALSHPITPLVQSDRESRWPAATARPAPPASAVPFQAETGDNPRYTPLVPASRVEASHPVRVVAEPSAPPARPTIQVTIGRVEVRAVQPPAPVARPKPARPRPALSLDAYLQQRKGGRP